MEPCSLSEDRAVPGLRGVTRGSLGGACPFRVGTSAKVCSPLFACVLAAGVEAGRGSQSAQWWALVDEGLGRLVCAQRAAESVSQWWSPWSGFLPPTSGCPSTGPARARLFIG